MSRIIKASKFAACALAFGAAGTALAGTIVVRSSASGYRQGQALPAGKVTLRAGESVVLIDGGGTRTLNGPGSFNVGAAQTASAPSALGALMRNTGARQVRTGAVRGANSGAAKSPNLWYVDTARSGTVCLAAPGQATLWRADMTQPVTLSLKNGAKSVPLTFAAGQAVRPWPADLPYVEGGEYWISGPGWAKPTSLRLVTVGAHGDAPDEVASALIAKGCTGQVDLIVETAQTVAATSG